MLGVVSLVGIDGDTQTRRDAQVLAFESQGDARDGLDHPVREHAGLVAVGIGQHDGEFVTAQPEQPLVAADDTGHLVADPDQQGVAGAVAKMIVNGLELVEVEEQQGTLASPPEGIVHGPAQLLLEAVTVV